MPTIVVMDASQALSAVAKRPSPRMRLKAFELMAEPPSIDANEITAKGYVNQRAGLERRNELLDKL
jgi:feruloyl-CoA synthase